MNPAYLCINIGCREKRSKNDRATIIRIRPFSLLFFLFLFTRNWNGIFSSLSISKWKEEIVMPLVFFVIRTRYTIYTCIYIYITWCVDRCPLPHRRLTNLYKAVKRVIRPYVSLSLSLSPFRARSPRVTLSFSLAS